MTTPVEGNKTIELRGSGAAFQSPDNSAPIHRGRVAEKEMDVVGFAAKLNHGAAHLARHRGKQVSKKGEVSENLATELRREDNLYAKDVAMEVSRTRPRCWACQYRLFHSRRSA